MCCFTFFSLPLMARTTYHFFTDVDCSAIFNYLNRSYKKPVPLLNTQSIAKTMSAMITEAIITTIALSWSSFQVGQDTLVINSLVVSCIYALNFPIVYSVVLLSDDLTSPSGCSDQNGLLRLSFEDRSTGTRIRT